MDWSRPVSTLVLALTVFAAVGALVSIVTTNPLLLSSTWQIPALVTLVISIAVVAVIILAGGPSREWKRTTYW